MLIHYISIYIFFRIYELINKQYLYCFMCIKSQINQFEVVKGCCFSIIVFHSVPDSSEGWFK